MANNDILIEGAGATTVVFADATDFTGTVSGYTDTDQIDLTSLATAAARQSAKADLGAKRARKYKVMVGLEFATAPVSLELVQFYWAPSPSSTAANANPGGCSGSDAAYTGTAGDSLADSLNQLQYLGALVCTADATGTVQYGYIGDLVDPLRYGSLVVYNGTSDNMHSDAVEMYVAFDPIHDEVA